MDIFNFIKENFNKNSIIFEIGTHFGTDGVKLFEATSCENLYGFEPDPRNIEVIKKRQRLPVYRALFEAAMSNEDGVADFYLSSGEAPGYFEDDDYKKDWSASNSLKKPKDHLRAVPWCNFNQHCKVRTTRLDTFCFDNSIKHIDFIWMDVQGAEDLVLEGAGEMLKHIKYIYTEHSPVELYDGSLTCSGILKTLGEDWEIIAEYHNDVLLKNKKI